MDSIRKLERALEQGYLLHGSPHILSELEPRQAHDKAKAGGNEEGVYATSNLVIAVWKGVARTTSETGFVGWSWNDNGQKRLYGEYLQLRDGYVYILPPDSFRPIPEDASDHVSPTEVTPIQTVRVTPTDLHTLQQEIDFVIDIR